MLRVSLELGGDLRLKIAALLKEGGQQLAVVLNFSRVVWRLARVVGNLYEAGIGETFSARKLKDAVIDSRLDHEQDAKSLCLRFHLYAHVLEVAGGFEGGCSAVDLLLVEGLAGLLHNLRRELGNFQFRASCDVDGRDRLAFIRTQNLRVRVASWSLAESVLQVSPTEEASREMHSQSGSHLAIRALRGAVSWAVSGLRHHLAFGCEMIGRVCSVRADTLMWAHFFSRRIRAAGPHPRCWQGDWGIEAVRPGI